MILACSANNLDRKADNVKNNPEKKLIEKNDDKKADIENKTLINNKKIMTNNKQPCWIDTNPNNCEKFKEDSKVYHFFSTSIPMSFTNYNKPETKESDLLKHLRGEYVSKIKSKIKSNIYYKLTCQKQGNNEQCEQKINEYIEMFSEGTVGSKEIELHDLFIKNRDDKKQNLHGLGRVLKTNYEMRIEEFRNLISNIPQKNIDLINEQTSIQNPNKDEKSIQNQKPNKNEKGIQKPKNEFKWIRKDQCVDIPFTNFTSENQIQSLYKEITVMLDSEIKEGAREGIYDNDRVMETNSEIYKANQDKTPEMINYYEEQTQKKMDTIIRCYEKKIREIRDKYSEKEMELFEKYNKESVKLTSFLKNLAEWEILIKQSLQYQSEVAELKRIFGERIRSLSHTYLTFIYANERSTNKNEKIINEYADQLVERELKKNKVKHYVTKQIQVQDNFAKVVLEDKYEVIIEKASTDGISFKPSSGCRAKIQKYLMIESPKNQRHKGEDIESIEELRAKSFILLGSDDVQLSYREEQKDYICINCDELQNVYSLLKDQSKEILDISKQKEKIQRFIKDVIMDNVQMVKTYSSLKKDFEQRLTNKKRNISQNNKKIRDLDKKMKKLLKIESPKPLLPISVRNQTSVRSNQEEIDRLKETIKKQYEKKIREVIGTILSKLQEHKKNKEIIVFSVIDKTEELQLEVLKKHIKEKYESIIETACPTVHKGKSTSTNMGPFHTEETTYRVTRPMIKGYAFPALRIKMIEGTDSRHYSLAMALKINCKSCQDEYRFIPKLNEILDVSKNYYWEVVVGSLMPQVRKSDKSVYENSVYQEYLDFCEGYESFLEKMTFSPYFQNWPRIKCLPGLVYNDLSKIILDYERREKWYFFTNKVNFSDVIGQSRNKGMRIMSYEKTKQLLTTIEKAVKAGDIDAQVLNQLRGKQFWTNSREGKRVSTIELRSDSSIYEDLVQRKTKAYGLFYAKF